MATILDLDDHCLTKIFQYLNKFDLFALRETNRRFIEATEICFKRNFADEQFTAEEWLICEDSDSEESYFPKPRLPSHLVPCLKEVIQYFGRFMKNVLIEEHLIELWKSESIPESFLCENMANVERVAIYDCIEKDEIGFISSWKKVKELNGDLGLEFGCLGDIYWPHLSTITVDTCDSDVNFIEFAKPHTNITKLHFKEEHNAKESGMIIEFIANYLPNLIDLNVGKFSANKNSSLIFTLANLESLVINIDNNLESFKNLKKLKYLEISDEISVQNLYDLVEFVPTLSHIKMTHSFSSAFDKTAAEGLVAKRMLSPYSEMEKLKLDGHIEKECRIFAKGSIASLDNEYVSCDYFKHSIDGITFLKQVLDRQFDSLNAIMSVV